jgi:hypothetical protein
MTTFEIWFGGEFGRRCRFPSLPLTAVSDAAISTANDVRV